MSVIRAKTISLEETRDHAEVVVANDQASGLSCIIAIYSTVLGPAMGGVRFLPYDSLDDAYRDALDLARAMTYKNACAGLDVGGGKAVIVSRDGFSASEAMFRSFGRVVDSLGGRYIAACDVGTRPEDMAVIGKETRWVVGRSELQGGSGDSGRLTATGVITAIRTMCRYRWSTDDLAKRRIAVQGLGKVGGWVAAYLVEAGAEVVVADVDDRALNSFRLRGHVEVVDVSEIWRVECDVFSPNALGGALSSSSIPELRCAAVVGGANNQLVDEEGDSRLLRERDILYAPDFLVNAGGIIQVANELHPAGYQEHRALQQVEEIGPRLKYVLEASENAECSPLKVAQQMAEERIRSIADGRTIWN